MDSEESSTRTVVVSGGAGLLGQSICRRLAQEGWTVIVGDIDGERAKQVSKSIQSEGGAAESARLDVTSSSSVAGILADVAARHGKIRGLVNSAYPRNDSYGRKLPDVTYESFCENVSLHLGGYFLTSQHFALSPARSHAAAIVNLGSIYGLRAPRFELYDDTGMTMPVEYAAIKAGVVQLTRYFAQYFKRSGLRCNVVAPGGVLDGQPISFVDRYNEMAGTHGMLTPDSVSDAVFFLLSDRARAITGQVLVVDDGWSL